MAEVAETAGWWDGRARWEVGRSQDGYQGQNVNDLPPAVPRPYAPSGSWEKRSIFGAPGDVLGLPRGRPSILYLRGETFGEGMMKRRQETAASLVSGKKNE